MPNLSAKSALLLAVAAVAAHPAPIFAASSAEACEASLDEGSLEADVARPTLKGEATSTRTVQLVIREGGEAKALYKSKVVRVRGGEWSLRLPKKLADGEYDVEVYCPRVAKGEEVASGELVVRAGEEPAKKGKKGKAAPSKDEAKAGAAVTVTVVPLLQGGVAGAGESVPVSYLQVRNTGKGAVKITGFKVRQTGSAPASAIASFTVVDGSGASRVTADAVFKNGVATAKSDVSIAAGGFALFTVKANLAATLGSAAGKNIEIEVTDALGAEKVSGQFPIKGTTWTLR